MPRTGGRQKGTKNKSALERMAKPAAAAKTPGRRGGRAKGTPNKKTLLVSEAKASILGGLTPSEIADMQPLDVLEFVMHRALEAGELDLAIKVACELVPYFHAKVKTKEATTDYSDEADITKWTDQQLSDSFAEIQRKKLRPNRTPPASSALPLPPGRRGVFGKCPPDQTSG